MRVGFWRFKEVLDSLQIVPTLAINARVPRLRMRGPRWKADGNSWGTRHDQRPIHMEPDQRATIQKAVRVIRGARAGSPPAGSGRASRRRSIRPRFSRKPASATSPTVDDEPCRIRTEKGLPVALPHTAELNDIPMMMIQHHASAEFEARCMDHFERLYAESADRMKVMAIAVHLHISGVPHRIKYFQRVLSRLKSFEGVVFWTGEQILDCESAAAT